MMIFLENINAKLQIFIKNIKLFQYAIKINLLLKHNLL